MADPMTPERRAEIREHLARTRDLNVCLDDWHLTLAHDAEDLLAEVERLRAELAETTHVLTVTGEKADALRGQRDRAEAERDAAWNELDMVRGRLTEESAGLAVAWQAAKDHKAERDRLAEQVKRARAKHRTPTEMDDPDHLLCSCGLHSPCPTRRALDGTGDGS